VVDRAKVVLLDWVYLPEVTEAQLTRIPALRERDYARTTTDTIRRRHTVLFSCPCGFSL